MRIFLTAAALALGPTLCGPTNANGPACEPCTAPEVCMTLCADFGSDVVASGCVRPVDGGYVVRDGGPVIACPR